MKIHDMFNLEGKNAVITGGASGIGLAMTRLFAKQGAMVHILEINYENAKNIEKEILDSGGKAKAHEIDITKQDHVKEIASIISNATDQVDILINNAGIAHIGNVEETKESDFDRVFSVNVKGTYNCIYSFIPYMKINGGVILNIASVAATVGIPDRFAYSSTKGAIVSMTLSIAKDYIKHGIRCNCISPARVHTPFVDGYLEKNYPGKELEMYNKLAATQPIGRMAQPDEIAALALYLCSEEASFITGSDFPIDGGFTRLNN
jgi:NAD(P)-dependent dehydrogenase (short-subunit alcohol dehydrogenase family)